MIRSAPMKRTSMPRKRAASKGEFHPAVRAEVTRRSGGRCEASTSACTTVASVMHHRLGRKQGGKGTAENALHLCNSCHLFIHSHPTLSYEAGWMIRWGVGIAE